MKSPQPTAQSKDILGLMGTENMAAPAEGFSVARRFERVRVKLHIKIYRSGEGGDSVETGQAQDVSEGGIGAYIPAELGLNESVKIEVVLPFGKRPIVFDAEVRDCRGFRYGFEFVNLKEEKRDELRQSLAAFATAH